MNMGYPFAYRARLIKRGLAYSPERGKLCFQLPRFAEFVEMKD
ncbi:hypothetical protein [Candidatus Weimeria sp. HCP3S3_B5]